VELFPDKRNLVNIIEQARKGAVCLPEFQREFVWKREEVADLLRSIVRRYYIGSLLLLRCEPNNPPFAPRFFRGAKPQYHQPRPEYLVLDGQQRITALLYALTAPNLGLKDSSRRRWFFLDLKLLLEDVYDDEIVFDRAEDELGDLLTEQKQYQQLVLPCTRLLNSRDFFKWRDGLDDWLRENSPADHQNFRDRWRDPWTDLVTAFQNYQVPLVELPRVEDSDSEAIGRVCAIFEKLNSTGVALSVYDLLTARLYRHGIKLHHLWEKACKAHPRLAAWSEGKAEKNNFGVLLLRTLALLRDVKPTPRELIDLDPENFEKDWRRAAQAMEKALELVTLVAPDGFGAFDPKWLPGSGLLPTLAALRATIEEKKLGEAARADLRRWYWCNVFIERYSSAVESKSRKDYTEMLEYWQKGSPEPSVFTEAKALIGSSSYTIRDSATTGSAVYSGVFCLLALRNARDWRRGEIIQLQDLQDHHIFPRGFLQQRGFTKRVEINTIVNRTLISDETNNKIKAKSPAEYLQSEDIFPAGPNLELLQPHFIGPDALETLHAAKEDLGPAGLREVYEKFLSIREAAIIAEIRRVTGVEKSMGGKA